MVRRHAGIGRAPPLSRPGEAPLTGAVYWHPRLYDLAMALLYGRGSRERVDAVAREIRDGESVLDVCCGSGLLARRGLAGRPVEYTGVDENEGFVRWLGARGIRALVADAARDPLPEADCVVLQASLYHFRDRAPEMLDRLLARARRRLVLSEPVSNVASSRFGPAAFLARHASATRSGPQPLRFREEELRALLDRYGAAGIRRVGKDLLAVIEVRRPAAEGG